MHSRAKLRNAAARLFFHEIRNVEDYNLLVEFIDEAVKGFTELDKIAAQQRMRAQLAEDFICMHCANCKGTVTDGVWSGVKSCCSTFPECGRFKSRHTSNIEAIRMRYMAADCKGVEKSILADVLRLLEEEVKL